MRALIFIFLAGFLGSAHAYDLECEKHVRGTHYTFAHIDVWPVLLAQVGTKECAGGGPVKLCFERPEDTVVDYDRVCGYPVNNRFECRTNQWNDKRGNRIVETSCPRWNERATLVVAPGGQGTLTCRNNGRVERRWSLGVCHFGN